MGGFGGNPNVDILAREFVGAFAQEYDPMGAAINYLVAMKAGFYPPQQQYPGPDQNFSGHKRPRVGGAPRPGTNGNWLCPNAGCGNVNFPKRTVCNRCNQPRPE